MNLKLQHLLDTTRPIYRRDLHATLGGQTRSGISTARKEPVVLLFSDPVSGPQHGYIDGWQADGFYHYTGEGQSGDQVMEKGNKAVRDHEANNRELHLFQSGGKGKPVTHMGQFRHVDHYDADAPQTGGGPLRRVLIFRLSPMGPQVSHRIHGKIKKVDTTFVDEVPIEASNTERAIVEPTREAYEAERKEAKLIADFIAWSSRAGRQFKRLKIVPKGEGKPIFSDLYSKNEKLLIEAKGSVSRDSIRMAIGQVFDYRRFADSKTALAILLPELPRPDLIDLIKSAGVGLIYRTHGGFATK